MLSIIAACVYPCMHALNLSCTAINSHSKGHNLPPAGKEPVSRKFQSLTAVGSQMVMFGGQSLEDNADLNDIFFLSKVYTACYCAAPCNPLIQSAMHHCSNP